MELHDGIVGTVCFFVGGLINNIIRAKQKKQELDQKNHELDLTEGGQIRRELWREVDKLKARIDEHTREIDHWKEKFYTLSEEHIQVKARCQVLEDEVLELRSQIAHTSDSAPQSLDSVKKPRMQ